MLIVFCRDSREFTNVEFKDIHFMNYSSYRLDTDKMGE